MVFTKGNNVKKMGRPPKTMQKDRLRQEFESVIRTGGRVKKAKKVFDPSENNPPKKRSRAQSNLDTERSKINNDSSENTNSGGASQQKSKTQHKRKNNGVLSYYKRRKLAEKSQNDFCTICSIKSNNLIHCKDCNLKVHQNCIKPKFQNSKLLESKWRCDSCKSCAICYENAETGPLITCAACVDCYHYKCHIPNMSSNKETNNINWLCTKCLPKPQFKPAILKSRRSTLSATLVRDNMILSKNDSSQSEKDFHNNNNSEEVKLDNDEKSDTDEDEDDDDDNDDDDDDDDDDEDNNDDNDDLDYVYDGKDENTENKNNINYDKIYYNEKKKILSPIPDVSNWSCDQLFNYIKEYFPAESKVLHEQEIDGASLLLLARSDIINGLKLKLGPAIRLYNFITALQTKKYDATATWIY